MDDQRLGPGGPAGDGLGRRVEAAAEARQVAGAVRPVGATDEAGDRRRRVAGQLLPGAVDPDQFQVGREPERRLPRLSQELIEPGTGNAGRRHEDDRFSSADREWMCPSTREPGCPRRALERKGKTKIPGV